MRFFVLVAFVALVYSLSAFGQSSKQLEIKTGVEDISLERARCWSSKSSEQLEIKTEFEEELFRSSYDVFLGASNPAAAAKVAKEAVRNRPNDLSWHKRLAQAAMWSNDQQTALLELKYLVANGDNDAIKALRDVAFMLGDDDTYINSFYTHPLDSKIDDTLIERLSFVIERSGRIDDGVAIFSKIAKHSPNQKLYSYLGRWYEYKGDVERAIESYKIALKLSNYDAKLAYACAILQYRQKMLKEAYETLAMSLKVADKSYKPYWELLGELAWRLDIQETAMLAYQNLLLEKDPSPYYYDRLIILTSKSDPLKAAKMQEERYFKEPTAESAAWVMSLYMEANSLSEAYRFFSDLSFESRKKFINSYVFTSIVGNMLSQIGNTKGALEYWEFAYKADSSSLDAMEAILWLLINLEQYDKVQKKLLHWENSLSESGRFAVLAAAKSVLGDYRASYYYALKTVAKDPSNAEAIMSLANAAKLTNNPKIAKAEWELVAKKIATNSAVDNKKLRFKLLQASVGARYSDLALPEEVKHLPQNEWYEWAINSGRTDIAHWRRDIDSKVLKSVPAYVDAALTLERVDAWHARRLLDGGKSSAIGVMDKSELAIITKRVDEPIYFLATQLQQDSYNDVAYDKMVELYNQRGQYGGFKTALSNSKAFKSSSYSLGASFRISENSNLQVILTKRLGVGLDENQVVQSHYDENTISLVLKRAFFGGDIRGSTALRQNGGKSVRWYGLEYQSIPVEGGTFNVKAQKNAPSTESAPLEAYGAKDTVSAGISIPIYASTQLIPLITFDNYKSIEGKKVGSALKYDFLLQRQWRYDYPNITTTLLYSKYNYCEDRNAPFNLPSVSKLGYPEVDITNRALPAPFRQYGIDMVFGDRVVNEWNRAFRPYFAASIFYNSIYGTSYNSKIGIVGGVIGGDRLHLWLDAGFTNTGAAGATTRGGFDYEFLY